jgi:hypothetical protein
MPTIATSETAATDAVLEHSRLVAQHNMLATDYADIPEANRDLYYQALALIEAARQVFSSMMDNSYEGAPLPYDRINYLRNRAVDTASAVATILASRL